ncbi:methyl-accepting chemotaxis protein [Clostridium felsineum]|uniref:methyl-accepting chemotaxis protein n=1 Tax=Clostridium felsineum TaxID=36839 RepID=UPI00098C6624|nr:methyl-accepting chemotaxis protein [Clostridium felsineum]URZ04193.1 Methyl-accepting chemotaxis protein McpB [Clostridium felsineum]
MRGIKGKLLLMIEALIIVVILGMAILAAVLSSNALRNNNASIMPQIAKSTADYVSAKVNDKKNTVEQITFNSEVNSSNKSLDEKLQFLNEENKRYKFIKIGIADLNGNVKYNNGTSTNIVDRPYFKKARSGEIAVSNPLIGKIEKNLEVCFTAPIKQNGNITGILVAINDGNIISSIADEIQFGKTGKVFAIDNTGIKIANYNKALVAKQDNDLVNVKKNPELDQIAAIERKMAQGQTGSEYYTYDKSKKFIAFAPIKDTTWSLGVVVDQSEMDNQLVSLQRYTIVLAIIFLVAAFLIVYLVASNLAKRIKVATDYIVPISSGDFTVEISEEHTAMKDEIGVMVKAIDKMQKDMKGMLKAVVDNSNKISENSESLSAISEEMNSSTEAVTLAVNEVTKGATSQAEEMSIITETINEFVSSLEEITEKVNDVDVNSRSIIDLAEGSGIKMNELAASIKEITTTFKDFEVKIVQSSEHIKNINEITEFINSIAEQTNLLALNAAIEAARAGEAGKGFAVVADEIRSLAEQAGESAEKISSLVSAVYSENRNMVTTTGKVGNDLQNQTSVVDNAVGSFTDIISSINEIIPKINQINKAVLKLNKDKNVIINKVEATAAISEETSAASEEISASSQEMNKSSDIVAKSAVNLNNRTKEMINEVKKFKL